MVFFHWKQGNKKMVSNVFKVEKEKPVNLELYMQKNIVNIAIILKILLIYFASKDKTVCRIKCQGILWHFLAEFL